MVLLPYYINMRYIVNCLLASLLNCMMVESALAGSVYPPAPVLGYMDVF